MGSFVVWVFVVGHYSFLLTVSLIELLSVGNVYVRLSCVMTGCFYSLSSPFWGAVCGYLVVSWLRGVHWTRWAFNLQLCPRLREQVRRLPRTKGGLAV